MKRLWMIMKDERGLSTVEIIVGMIALASLSIGLYYSLRGGINTAGSAIGNKVYRTVEGSTYDHITF